MGFEGCPSRRQPRSLRPQRRPWSKSYTHIQYIHPGGLYRTPWADIQYIYTHSCILRMTWTRRYSNAHTCILQKTYIRTHTYTSDYKAQQVNKNTIYMHRTVVNHRQTNLYAIHTHIHYEGYNYFTSMDTIGGGCKTWWPYIPIHINTHETFYIHTWGVGYRPKGRTYNRISIL